LLAVIWRVSNLVCVMTDFEFAQGHLVHVIYPSGDAGRLHLHDEGDPWISGVLRAGEPFELHVMTLLSALLPRDGVFLDVGANIGVLTVLGSLRVGPGGRVFAVEPEPENLALLRANVKANGLENTRVIAGAAGALRGFASLQLPQDNRGDHRIGGPGGTRPSLTVPILPLDSVGSLWQRPIDLIKLDVQGAEAQALRGLAGLLASNRRVRIICEYWPHGLEAAGESTTSLLTALGDHHNVCWLVEGTRLMRRTSFEELRGLAETVYRPETGWHADIVCLHPDDTDGITRCDALAATWSERMSWRGPLPPAP
jgi:FkbM family methyltransferase